MYSNYNKNVTDMEYDAIIKTAYEENPLPETPAKKRGRKKKQSIKFDLQTGQLQGIRLKLTRLSRFIFK